MKEARFDVMRGTSVHEESFPQVHMFSFLIAAPCFQHNKLLLVEEKRIAREVGYLTVQVRGERMPSLSH